MSSQVAEASAPPPPTAKCEHKFVHFETIRYLKSDIGTTCYYVRIDRFFCERCLHEEEKRRETYSIEVPDWYRKS